MENVLRNSDVINAMVNAMSPFGEIINTTVLSLLTIYVMSCLSNIASPFIEMLDDIFPGTYGFIKSYVAISIAVIGLLWYLATTSEKIMLVIMITNIILVVKILQKLFHLIKGD